ncbi:PREDICTED: uncharacterized protein LOC104723526 isoform X2 [Camelina sativa]|nr:PREDICTED: uncharacterized protein LOC104723526 isoform X2 [Camelina sativa]
MVGGVTVDPSMELPPLRKGIRPVWPKPMYKVKQSSGEKKSQSLEHSGVGVEDTSMEVNVENGSGGGDQDLEDQGFNESTDDLLEDGEFDDVDIPEDSRQGSKIVMEAGLESGLGGEDNNVQGTNISAPLYLSLRDMNDAIR